MAQSGRSSKKDRAKGTGRAQSPGLAEQRNKSTEMGCMGGGGGEREGRKEQEGGKQGRGTSSRESLETIQRFRVCAGRTEMLTVQEEKGRGRLEEKAQCVLKSWTVHPPAELRSGLEMGWNPGLLRLPRRTAREERSRTDPWAVPTVRVAGDKKDGGERATGEEGREQGAFPTREAEKPKGGGPGCRGQITNTRRRCHWPGPHPSALLRVKQGHPPTCHGAGVTCAESILRTKTGAKQKEEFLGPGKW